MQQAVLIEELQVDHHQLHINVPPEMGMQFRVIVMPLSRTVAADSSLSADEAFNLAAYSVVTEENSEEDAIWEKYVRA